jgi:hypothetical protein
MYVQIAWVRTRALNLIVLPLALLLLVAQVISPPLRL